MGGGGWGVGGGGWGSVLFLPSTGLLCNVKGKVFFIFSNIDVNWQARYSMFIVFLC